jgi:U3 small nucleolar RNA-associated protein 23
MKLKRYKKIQRRMGFFEKNFKFRAPFQILLDGTFAQAALMTKVNIQDQLPKYLNAPVKLLTSPCIVTETENIGPQVFGALNILKQYPTHKCSHGARPKSADKCILSMVNPNNPNRYIIATQDQTLRERLRAVPGVALLYLHGNAPTLEKPSEKTEEFASAQSLQQTQVLEYQKEILDAMKNSTGAGAAGNAQAHAQTHVHKGTIKRKRAGPNPLSCKKRKSKSSATASASTSAPSSDKTQQKKRKRIKVKVPKHVKAERSNSNSKSAGQESTTTMSSTTSYRNQSTVPPRE